MNSEPITISAVVAVAHGRRVSVAPACLERLKEAREAMLLTLENGKPVYGVTTGVGALRGIKVDPAEAAHFNRLLILSHRVSHGDAVPRAVVRAAMLCRAQGLSLGGAGVRPAVIEALIDALNADEIPTVHAIGSVGQRKSLRHSSPAGLTCRRARRWPSSGRTCSRSGGRRWRSTVPIAPTGHWKRRLP